MYICVSVCMCVCGYVDKGCCSVSSADLCICICVYIYMYVCMYVCVCMYLCMYVCMNVCVWVHDIWMEGVEDVVVCLQQNCVCVYMCECVYVCVCTRSPCRCRIW
jgi:hypothetical protein